MLHLGCKTGTEAQRQRKTPKKVRSTQPQLDVQLLSPRLFHAYLPVTRPLNAKWKKKQLSSTSLRHLSTAIHIQPGSTSKRPPRTFSCDELCRLDCVLRSKTWRMLATRAERKLEPTERMDQTSRNPS